MIPFLHELFRPATACLTYLTGLKASFLSNSFSSNHTNWSREHDDVCRPLIPQWLFLFALIHTLHLFLCDLCRLINLGCLVFVFFALVCLCCFWLPGHGEQIHNGKTISVHDRCNQRSRLLLLVCARKSHFNTRSPPFEHTVLPV